RLGSVDRVQNPAEASRPGFLRKLFAHYGVVRKGMRQPVADQQFRAAVRFGHWGRISLAVDLQIVTLVMTENQVLRLAGNLETETQSGSEVGGREGHAGNRYAKSRGIEAESCQPEGQREDIV